MCRKLSFLVYVVLFCTGTVVAVPIDDPNYNLSFEWHWPDIFGLVHQIRGHTGIDATPPTPDSCDPNLGVFNWLSTGSGFQGVDIFCPDALDSPTHCHNWPATDGIGYIYLQHSGNGIDQVLDGNDANAVITAGRKYTMKFDAMDFGTTGVRGEFYSASADPIASESFILPEIFQPLENCDAGAGELDPNDECPDWHRDLTVSFIALEGDPYIGETLSLRFEANGGGGSYAFMDNVRLEWIWLTSAPVACIVGGDRVVEAGEDCVTRVVLDGSCSSDADSTAGTNDDINDFDWYEVIDVCEPNSDIYIGSGEVIECNLALGEHLIILEVTDKAGAFDTNEVVITVEDVTPPEFSLWVEPNVLWPPNNKMVLVTPGWEVSDNCDEEVEVSLVDITMSAEGDVNDYVQIGGDGSIYLRAKKGQGRNVRIYTLTYETVDDWGNVAIDSTTVVVPQSQRFVK